MSQLCLFEEPPGRPVLYEDDRRWECPMCHTLYRERASSSSGWVARRTGPKGRDGLLRWELWSCGACGWQAS